MSDILLTIGYLALLLGLATFIVERAIDRQRRRKMSGYEIEQRLRWHNSAKWRSAQERRIAAGELAEAHRTRREAQEAKWHDRV